jgi:rhamnose transport system substrate-binding protein
MTWNRPRSVALACAASFLLVACGGGGGGSTSSGSKLNIAFLPKQVNNAYFDVAASGGQEAAGTLKGQFKQVGPSTASGSAQVPYIQTLTQQHVSAIVVSADDPDAIAPALKQAMQKGIKVVGYDSSPAKGAYNVFVNQADLKSIGEGQAKLICDEIGNPCSGEIGVVSAASTATNQNAWIMYMQQALQSNPQYAGLKLDKVVYGNDDPQTSVTVTQGLLQAYPNLKGIVAPTSVGIVAAAQVLEQTGKAGKVALTGLGTPNDMKKYVKDGTCKEFALWNVKDLGYLSYYVAALLAQGKLKGQPGDKFTAGRLGSYTVGTDGVVVLGPPFVFNASNIDQFNF